MSSANLRANFETLCRAIHNQDATLLECMNAATKEKIAVICATNTLANGLLEFVPLAKMLEDPLEEVLVPASLRPPEINPEVN